MNTSVPLFDPAEDYEIEIENGQMTGIGKHLAITVEGGKCFRRIGRRIFQHQDTPGWKVDEQGSAKRCILVGELDGVRTYILQMPDMIHMIMTKREVNP